MLVIPVTSESYGLGDLDRKGADAAGGAVDQHRLPGLDFSVVAPPWSAVTAAIGTAAASSKVRRLRRHDAHWHRNVLRKAAVAVISEAGIDLVAGLELGNDGCGRHPACPAMSPPRILCFGRSKPEVAREKKGLARIERQSAGFTDIPSTFTGSFVGVRRRLPDLRDPAASQADRGYSM